jgi:hydroxymethylpyrimidine/phosphomethylpyrimidine kinase
MATPRTPRLVVISPPEIRPDEALLVKRLFAAGLERWHLRKPGVPIAEVERLLEGLTSEERARTVTHRHPELVEKYGLLGYHLRETESSPVQALRLGRSLHPSGALRLAHAEGRRVTISSDPNTGTPLFEGHPEWLFLSPLFPSLSKDGYGTGEAALAAHRGLRDWLELRRQRDPDCALLALGGIGARQMTAAAELGFDGAAVLGALWNAPDPELAFVQLRSEADRAFSVREPAVVAGSVTTVDAESIPSSRRSDSPSSIPEECSGRASIGVTSAPVQGAPALLFHERPLVLSIAGYDPSGGAGVVADLRAIEAAGSLGQAAVTGLTHQNDREFLSLEWCEASCGQQLEALFRRAQYDVAKIGLIPSLDFLEQLVERLRQHNPAIQILWDPILKASAGFTFHDLGPRADAGPATTQRARLARLLPKLSLVTPNLPEAEVLFPGLAVAVEVLTRTDSSVREPHQDEPLPGILIQLPCPVLLKGGHGTTERLTDWLLQPGCDPIPFAVERVPGEGKHGSGCTISALIAAFLAQGENLPVAIRRARPLMDRFMRSSKTLLGTWGAFEQSAPASPSATSGATPSAAPSPAPTNASEAL